MAVEFRPGTELAARYYQEVVGPLLDQHAPGLRHAAALIGWGSEVLGFDSPRSTDHNWGPRCQIFLGEQDMDRAGQVAAMLEDRLPATFSGWPTRFIDATTADTAPRHWVEVAGIGAWLTGRLGFDPRAGVGLDDWLASPTQLLAEITGGAVFSDALAAGSGLHAARAALRWYPDDVWRYVLACQWARIGQEEAFPGRCAEAGDDLGSAILAARLSRDVMRLMLLMHRAYPPYSKWLGSAFARLPGLNAGLRPALLGAVTARSWPEREQNLCAAYEEVAALHNGLGLSAEVDGSVRPYFDRPFLVIGAERFAAALRESIADDEIRRLPAAGAVDEFVDSTDALGDQRLLRAAVSALHPQPLGRLSTGQEQRLATKLESRRRSAHGIRAPPLPRPPRPDPARRAIRVSSASMGRIRPSRQVAIAQRQMAATASRRLCHLHRRAKPRRVALGCGPARRTWGTAEPLLGR